MWSRSAVPLALLLSVCSSSSDKLRVRSDARALPAPPPARPELVLANEGRAQVAIYAPERLFEEPAPSHGGKKKRTRARLKPGDRLALTEARRLLASVTDLARFLSELSGAEVQVHRGLSPPPSGVAPILVGELAQQRFGPPHKHALGGQGFRIVIARSSVVSRAIPPRDSQAVS